MVRIVAYRSPIGDILAVVHGTGDGNRVPVRVHDACLTGEVFGSLKCDCGPQLQKALTMQSEQRLGIVIYMPQEGRGIGLANKVAAYTLQEEHGLDTVDANLALGLPAEMRDYSAVQTVLDDLGVRSILLMTNNPFKVQELLSHGIVVKGTLPVVVPPNAQATQKYLETKRRRMGHVLPDSVLSNDSSSTDDIDPAADLLSSLRREIRGHSGDRPFTILSFATSMDGFIAGIDAKPDGYQERRQVSLSGKQSSTLTHHLRGLVDVILVGLGTVQTDNPRLDVRVGGAGLSPRPVVLDSQLRLPPDSRLLTHKAEGGRPPVLVLCTTDADSEHGAGDAALRQTRAAALQAAGATILHCHTDSHGHVCMHDAWRQLHAAGVRSIMVEGGAQVISGLLNGAHRLVDRLVVTQAGMLLGNGVSWATDGSAELDEVSTFTLGRDAIFTGRLRNSSPR